MPWMQSAAAWASVKVCLCAVFARHWDDHVELQQGHVELQQDHVELQQDHVELPRLAYFCQCLNSMCAIDIMWTVVLKGRHAGLALLPM